MLGVRVCRFRSSTLHKRTMIARTPTCLLADRIGDRVSLKALTGDDWWSKEPCSSRNGSYPVASRSKIGRSLLHLFVRALSILHRSTSSR